MSAARTDAAICLIRHAVAQASRPTTTARTARVHIDVATAAVASVRRQLRDGEELHPVLADLEGELRGLGAQLEIDGLAT